MNAESSGWHAGGVMISRTGYGRCSLLMMAAGFSLALVIQAHAQAVPPGENDTAAAESVAPDTNDADTKDPDAKNADIKDLELDWSLLNVDVSTLISSPASKTRLAPAGAGNEMSCSTNQKPNGSASVSVYKSVTPIWY